MSYLWTNRTGAALRSGIVPLIEAPRPVLMGKKWGGRRKGMEEPEGSYLMCPMASPLSSVESTLVSLTQRTMRSSACTSIISCILNGFVNMGCS